MPLITGTVKPVLKGQCYVRTHAFYEHFARLPCCILTVSMAPLLRRHLPYPGNLVGFLGVRSRQVLAVS